MYAKKIEKHSYGERERDDRKVNMNVNVKKEREKRVCMCAREIIYIKKLCVSGCLIEMGKVYKGVFARETQKEKKERERQTEMKREGARPTQRK